VKKKTTIVKIAESVEKVVEETIARASGYEDREAFLAGVGKALCPECQGPVSSKDHICVTKAPEASVSSKSKARTRRPNVRANLPSVHRHEGK
jgi:hypothetical protein